MLYTSYSCCAPCTTVPAFRLVGAHVDVVPRSEAVVVVFVVVAAVAVAISGTVGESNRWGGGSFKTPRGSAAEERLLMGISGNRCPPIIFTWGDGCDSSMLKGDVAVSMLPPVKSDGNSS